MQRPNPFSSQRFQLNGGRNGGVHSRALTGPFAMIIAVVMFFILLGATIVGSVAFLLIRGVLNLARAIGEGLSMALPSGKKSRPSPSRRQTGNPQPDAWQSSSDARPADTPASSSPKTISLQKDASGSWRSED